MNQEESTVQGSRGSAKSRTLIERAYTEIKQNIIVGHHVAGDRLRIEHLAREYDVSGGTLREALTMLIADGLVIAEGQRGFTVRGVSIEDLVDLMGARILLEKEALRQSIKDGDEVWEARLVSSFHLLNRAWTTISKDWKDRGAFEEWERRHRDFHAGLLAASRSTYTRHFLAYSNQQYERYRHMFFTMARTVYKEGLERPVDTEHAEIFNAVMARDTGKATKLLEQHLLRTLDEWVAFFKGAEAFQVKAAVQQPDYGARASARQG